ncbi:MAG TPA: PilN domain-containing protein, partial [Gemmatimonadales bacterium]|nr:PilN domain-containing protein [Gemmatimonadales bacterium]
MIEINLLPGQKRKAAGGGGLRMPDFRSFVANVKDPWLLGAIAAGVLLIGGNLALYAVNTARLARLDSVLRGVQAEKRRYDAVVAQKRQAERVRDSLAAEMAIIRAIDGDRYVWPHLLDEITKALPAYTWLTGIQATTGVAPAVGVPPGTAPDTSAAQGVRVAIDGRTVDIQAYTTFLRQLAASPWLADVMPTRATTVIEQDRPVTEFNITVRYRQADSLY